MLKTWLALAVGFAAIGAQAAPPASPPAAPGAAMSLWRLDCGSATIADYNAFFSDTSAYPAGPKEIVDSCYLIRHGDTLLLWDTGLPDALIGHPSSNRAMTMRVTRSLVDQLAAIGVKPEQVAFVAISHYHGDHTGQAAHFTTAKLLIGKGDLDVLRAAGKPDQAPLAAWIGGGSTAIAPAGDLDIFQDGEVVMLSTPGHTPGHHSLLVRLASGPVILAGDLWHFKEQMAIDGVPPFNSDRAQTLASMDRIKRLAANLHARIVIGHEPADVAALPAFPKAAR